MSNICPGTHIETRDADRILCVCGTLFNCATSRLPAHDDHGNVIPEERYWKRIKAEIEAGARRVEEKKEAQELFAAPIARKFIRRKRASMI